MEKNNDYNTEYLQLLSIIKNKLKNTIIKAQYRDIYIKYLEIIEERVTANFTDEEYQEVIDTLYTVLSEIEELEAEAKKPNADDRKRQRQLVKVIKRLKEKIKLNKRIITIAQAKIIAYLLITAMAIYNPLITYQSIKRNDEYQVLLPTRKTIYSSVDNTNTENKYPAGIMVVGKEFTYDIDYLSLNDVGNMGYIYDNDGFYNMYYEINEKSPWIKDGREAYRTIKTCTIPYYYLGNVVDLDDIDNLFNIYGYVTHKEVVLQNEISRKDRDFYRQEGNENASIYEVIKYQQDMNHPITKYQAKDYTDVYLMLLGEAIVWYAMVELTNMTILEGIITSLGEIRQSRKLTAKQERKLTELQRLYSELYRKKKQKNKNKTKKKWLS